MSEALWFGLALMLVFEGIMPFVSPASWRATMQKLASLNDRQIRIVGFCFLIAGALLALLARN